MKKPIIFSIILLFSVMSIVSFSSCILPRDHIYHFTPHDSLYFNAYDTACYYTFKTSKGLDSLWINEKVCIDLYKKWQWNIGRGDLYLDPYFHYDGVLIHNGCKENFYLCYEKLYENTDPVLKVTVGERYALPVDDSRNMKSEGIYNDTIIIDDANSFVNHSLEHCYEFEYLIWHKYKGIIGYKLSDGTIFPDSTENPGLRDFTLKIQSGRTECK